jgi:hypothetical protein
LDIIHRDRSLSFGIETLEQRDRTFRIFAIGDEFFATPK